MDPQTQTPQSQPEATYHKSRMYIYILGAVALIFVALALTLFKERQDVSKTAGQNNTVNTAVPTVTTAKGSFALMTEDGTARYASGSAVAVQVAADSEGEDVVGYDVLVTYDTSAFEYVSATSLLEDFTVFAKDRPEDGVVSVTAAKAAQVDAATPLSGAALQLQFRSKKAGSYSFTLTPALDKETTKFVNEQTSVLTPSLGSLAVEIF